MNRTNPMIARPCPKRSWPDGSRRSTPALPRRRDHRGGMAAWVSRRSAGYAQQTGAPRRWSPGPVRSLADRHRHPARVPGRTRSRQPSTGFLRCAPVTMPPGFMRAWRPAQTGTGHWRGLHRLGGGFGLPRTRSGSDRHRAQRDATGGRPGPGGWDLRCPFATSTRRRSAL